MKKFRCLVVLDLESSGLPCHPSKPKITELAMVGILREHINVDSRIDGDLPRVVNKLSVCFYPKKMIHFEASEITGLDNELLEEYPPWNMNICTLITSFLQHMPSPICIVAHNGKKFDFQLLKSEILAHNQSFPDDILWADTLLAFRDLHSSKQNGGVSGIHLLNNQSCELGRLSVPAPIFEIGMSENPVSEEKQMIIKNVSQVENETTPKREITSANVPLLKRKESAEHCICSDRTSVKVRKQLFSPMTQPKSFRLVDIYKHIYGCDPPVSHSAEGDAIALLKCIIATGPEILSYFDLNNLKFSEIPCMW